MRRFFFVFLAVFIYPFANDSNATSINVGSSMEISEVSGLEEKHLGKTVIVRGKVSKTPWQHMIDGKPKGKPEYFDLKSGHQIVVYVKEPIQCPDEVSLTGVVTKVEGRSKRPGEKEEKMDEKYVEYQLVVSSWKCLSEKSSNEDS